MSHINNITLKVFTMKYITIIILACILTACPFLNSDNDVPPNFVCGKDVVISAKKYKNGPSDQLNIISAEIKGDSLYIEFGSSGCDGSSWELCLYDADVILESYPEQRNIRLSLKNEEECDAYFTKKVAFNIKPLQTQSDKIYLNLQGWNEQLLYSNNSSCGKKVVISSEKYKNGASDHLSIIDAVIKGDSLHIEFGSSGCDGSTWEVCLFDADEILESNPEQRNIRLSLKNEEMCDAYFKKKVAFDISPLQTQSDKIALNLKDWNKQLLYKY